MVTFSWDTRRTELPPVTPLLCRKTNRLGEGEPPHGKSGDTQGSGCTSEKYHQLGPIR